jgi:KamA family protein
MLPAAERRVLEVVSAVLPFRTNSYVLEDLIDWCAVPDDPIYQLTFPHRGMLSDAEFSEMDRLLRSGPPLAVEEAARRIRSGLNPNPAAQATLNVPVFEGAPLPGVQHKYRETVLFFPAQGQTCHAFCSYCFRWSQFVGDRSERFASGSAGDLVRYLAAHSEVTDVLLTGGDPLTMSTTSLRECIEPLLADELSHVTTIRIGTKAPAFWPHRFVLDADSDALLALFEKVLARGRRLVVMAHYSHPRELSTPIAQAALARIIGTGALVFCQAPIMAKVNDGAETWRDLIRQQLQLGAVPYYMFIARDTGARRYFALPLMRAHEIFREATSLVSGLARTLRGPVMSTADGKVVVDGVAEVSGRRAFVLRYLQARDPGRVGIPFLAGFDPRATWFDELAPFDG